MFDFFIYLFIILYSINFYFLPFAYPPPPSTTPAGGRGERRSRRGGGGRPSARARCRTPRPGCLRVLVVELKMIKTKIIKIKK